MTVLTDETVAVLLKRPASDEYGTPTTPLSRAAPRTTASDAPGVSARKRRTASAFFADAQRSTTSASGSCAAASSAAKIGSNARCCARRRGHVSWPAPALKTSLSSSSVRTSRRCSTGAASHREPRGAHSWSRPRSCGGARLPVPCRSPARAAALRDCRSPGTREAATASRPGRSHRRVRARARPPTRGRGCSASNASTACSPRRRRSDSLLRVTRPRIAGLHVVPRRA